MLLSNHEILLLIYYRTFKVSINMCFHKYPCFNKSKVVLLISIQGKFEFESHDYEKQLLRLLSRKERTDLIINNPSQSLFLFVDKHHLQVKLLNSCNIIFYL